MLKLCGFRISNDHNKVRLALLEKGLEHEEDATCTPKQTEEQLARSPMGKVPFLELDGGRRLTESQAICEYQEEAYPQHPLLPRDPWVRAQVLILHMELYLEQAVEKELARGMRAFRALARFAPFIAGPLVSLATKIGYGRDALADVSELKRCLAMLGGRPAFRQVNEDRKAAQGAATTKK